jgi:hypothetical protein
VPDTRVGLLLKNIPEMQALNRALRQLTALRNAVLQVLPANLAGAVSVTQTMDGQLILAAVDGAVAAKLLHFVPRIQNILHQQGFEITGIRVQVQLRMPDNPLPQKQIFISEQASTAINTLSERLVASPLKRALKRLGRRRS